MAAPTLDPPLPGSDPDSGTRRLAAGDWVHVSGPEPSLTGIGKIVDGDYAPRDSVLLQAKVELARGSYWFSPTALARVEPGDEAVLCEEALALGTLSPRQGERVRGDVESLRRGELTFVRSPGLLDRLWSYLGEAEQSTRGGLARLFDEGATVLAAARRRAHARPIRVAERAGKDAGRERGDRDKRNDPERWEPAPPESLAPSAIVLARVLFSLDAEVHYRIAEACGIFKFVAQRAPAAEVRAELLRERVDLSRVLGALTYHELLHAGHALSIPYAATSDELRAAILAEEARFCSALASLAPGGSAPAPSRPVPPEPVLIRVLRALDLGPLRRVAAVCADLVFVSLQAPAPHVRGRLFEDVPLSRVLAELNRDELLGVSLALALPPAETVDQLRAQILEEEARVAGGASTSATPRSEPAPASQSALGSEPTPAEPGEPVLPKILASLGISALHAAAEACSVPVERDASVVRLLQVLEDADVDLFALLGPLGREELKAVCRALGLRATGGSADLRERILEEADSRAGRSTKQARVSAEERLASRSPVEGSAVEAAPALTATPAPEPVKLENALHAVTAQLGIEALVRVAEACDVPAWDGPLEADLRARILGAGVSLERALGALHDHELRDVSLAVGLPGDGTGESMRAALVAADRTSPAPRPQAG